MNAARVDYSSAIRELRLAIGDSQQAFATRLGLSISSIAKFEGGRVPSAKILKKLVALAGEYSPEKVGYQVVARLRCAELVREMLEDPKNVFMLLDDLELFISRAIEGIKLGDTDTALRMLTDARSLLNERQNALLADAES